jgi:signal transduction histidine kinase
MAFDKRLMKLAIRQLLDNALKYTSAETAVEMGAQVKDGVLRVEITDYGKGIPADEQLRIFDRFYRSPSVPVWVSALLMALCEPTTAN